MNNLIHRTNDLLANDFDERKQFNNQIILKFKNLNVEIRKTIVLNDEFHQLKNITIKLTIMTYDLITQIVVDIVQQNSNLMNENFNDDENNVEKLSFSSIITNQTKIQFKFIHIIEKLIKRRFFFIISKFNEIIIFDFFLRIKVAYDKNKNIKIIIKIKKNDDRKISTKFIKKNTFEVK